MLPFVLIYISIIVWFLPIFKNRKTGYFYYFYILAISDPVRMILYWGLRIASQFPTIILTVLLIAALLKTRRQQITAIIISCVLSVCAYIFRVSSINIFIFALLTSFVVFYLILIRFVEDITETKSLNLFLLMLLVYEAVTIFREIAVLINPEYGAVSYFLGGSFQILFGIAFIFVTIDTKRFKLVKEPTK